MNDEVAGAGMRFRPGADRSVLLIVGNGARRLDAADSIALAGMRVAEDADWTAAAERISHGGAHDEQDAEDRPAVTQHGPSDGRGYRARRRATSRRRS